MGPMVRVCMQCLAAPKAGPSGDTLLWEAGCMSGDLNEDICVDADAYIAAGGNKRCKDAKGTRNQQQNKFQLSVEPAQKQSCVKGLSRVKRSPRAGQLWPFQTGDSGV